MTPEPAIAIPPAGSSYVDPAYGSVITRVTDAVRDGAIWRTPEYSTMSPFNCDGSFFLLILQDHFGLYSGAGAYLHDLPISASGEPRWSRTVPGTLYFHETNQLWSCDVTTGALTVLHTFGAYSAISGAGESEISPDGDHLVLCGDGKDIFVFTISTNTEGLMFSNAPPFDSLYIADGNQVLISWTAQGPARFAGMELFDADMLFLRQLATANGHKCLAHDSDGSAILVWTNSDEENADPAWPNAIMKIRLADGLRTGLLALPWSQAVHISCPASGGVAFVSTEAAPTAPWVEYTNELLRIPLDGSPATRLAQHRSVINSYNAQPKVTSSRDGSRLLYASNFGNVGTVDYADTFMTNGVAVGPVIAGVQLLEYLALYGTELADATVTVGGLPAVLTYDAAGQVNIVVPAALVGKGATEVVVTCAGVPSKAYSEVV